MVICYLFIIIVSGGAVSGTGMPVASNRAVAGMPTH